LRHNRRSNVGGTLTPPLPVEAGLLTATPEGVVGWAWRPGAPEQPLQVFLLANDVVVGSGVANRFDIESVRASVGPGVPGFLIPFSVFPDSPFPLALTIREANGTSLAAPLIVRNPEQLGPLPRAMPADPTRYEGIVEGLRDGHLIGWIMNHAEPEHAVMVELFDGVERLDRRSADIFRGDLANSGKRGGHCAFCFELPATLLDGRAHLLRVRIAGSALELTNSPVGFGPLAATALIQEISSLRTEVQRLSHAVDFAVAPDGAFQSGLVRDLCDRVAAYAEIQREMIESELDALRAMALTSRPLALKPGRQAPMRKPRKSH
jgi:hypothetical protein